MMKPIFKMAALAAVLLTSNAAQAHQFQNQINEWKHRLTVAGEQIRSIECYAGGTDDTTRLTTCQPANAAVLAVDMLDTIKPTATDAEARHMFRLVHAAIDLSEYDETIMPMFEKLKASDDKRQRLANGLDEMMHTGGYILKASIEPKG